MKFAEENGNPFLKQVSKLFEDLANGQKDKSPVPTGPRITCTRLRRLREIRCELVETSDPDLSTIGQNELEDTVAQLNTTRTKNESFAAWVLRNKQMHQQLSSVPNELRVQIYTNNKDDKKKNNSNNAFSNFSPAALQKVARDPSTSRNILKWLASHYKPDIRQAVAENPNAGHEIMEILVADVDDGVRIMLAKNAKLSRNLLIKLCDDVSPLVAEKAKNSFYEQNKFAITKNQIPVPTEHLIILPSPAQLAAEAVKENDSPATPLKDTISEPVPCLKHGDKNKTASELIEREFLQVIAERATTPPRRLAELSLHPDELIRCTVAANPNATPEILWQLAKDDSIEVRKKILSNYNCPEDIINYLKQK